jgi:hypothetical protein
MAISATDVTAGPRARRTAISSITRAPLLDADGAMLCQVALLGPPRDGCLILRDVDEPSVLLAYCFGRSQRDVMLDLADDVVEGHLETRWESGHRTWRIDLT